MDPTTLGHYRIIEKLGAGGQGTVYKGIDTRLGRSVVIKTIPPELTSRQTNLKRFEREAQLASSLDHPNICTIFDFNEIDGIHFIAMQLVPGRNVRELVKGRPLELNSALSIAIQVADALTAAHARGIIHRDIKANNVMVMDGGQVKVLDFGLAKLVEEEPTAVGAADRTQLTEIGVPYGTATYAAPEQARGDRVDHRADIFSTGVLLYEMLTGTWPFHGKNVIDVRHAVLHETPVPLAQVRPGITPPRLQEILDRAMAKNPSDRYQKISELRDDLQDVLRQISNGTMTPALAGHLVAPRHADNGAKPLSRALRWLRQVTHADHPETHASSSALTSTEISAGSTDIGVRDDKKKIAILPFKNFRGDPQYAFYEFSLADAVITELARLRTLTVRPSSLIAKYQGKDPDPREAGREMNVDAVLSAGFLHGGDRIRVTAQLLDVATGEILQSERIDADARDLIAVQDTIAQRIVESMSLEIAPEEKPVTTTTGSKNADAYEAYLRGRDAFARFIFRSNSPDDCDAALAFFKRAIELDPKFGLAYDGLGACHVNRVFKGLGDASDFSAAEAAFNDALALDPEIVEARMLNVFVHLWHGEKQRARAEVEKARQQYPDEAVVYFVKATLHRLNGEYKRSLRAWARLAELDPAAETVALFNRALVFIFRGRIADALHELDLAADSDPGNPLARSFRALALFYQSIVNRTVDGLPDSESLEQATDILRKVLEEFPTMDGIKPFLAMCLAADGDNLGALEQLTDDVRRNAEVDPDISYSLGAAYALIGDKEQALKWLGLSIDIGNSNYRLYMRDPVLESIRDTPEFKGLLARIAEPQAG